MSTDHQTLMDQAYDRWSKGDLKGAGRQDFLDALSPQVRSAVLIGNLNYQWGNGGIAQWHSNRYSENLGQLRGVLRRMIEKRIALAADVLGLVDKAMAIFESDMYQEADPDDDGSIDKELDEIDTAYYAIDSEFMAEFQKYLNQGGY